MKLTQLVAASNAADAVINKPKRTHSILIYGMPKVGKTELAATIAKVPEIKRVFYFGGENGHDTIVDMHRRGKLTWEELDKFILVNIPDTRESPVFIETLLKSIASKQAVDICEEHGRVACPLCKTKPSIRFDHSTLTAQDVIIIDSLSQAGVSALNVAMRGMSSEAKAGWDEYGLQGRMLSDLCITIQAAQFTNFICITHVQILENDEGKDVYTPLCGTKTFSSGLAKYFGSVIFTEMKLKKHKAGSSTSYNSMTQAGSRIGLVLEKEDELDLSVALPKAGLFLGTDSVQPKAEEAAPKVEATQEEKPKPAFGSKPVFGSK